MPNNPYHNWKHVVDVTQVQRPPRSLPPPDNASLPSMRRKRPLFRRLTTLGRASPQMAYALAQAGGLWVQLRGNERLALLLAALCHDFEHPGVSAAYLQKAQSRLAAWFRDDPGLLEKHHSVRAFELLACKRIGLLAHLPTADRVEVRGLVRELILATDMSQHGLILASIEKCLSAPGPAPGLPAGKDSSEEERGLRLLWLRLVVKCADVSNVTKKFATAMEWGVMVTDEMFAQGDRERAEGLEVCEHLRTCTAGAYGQ
jgi:hypothetical protein